MKNQNIIQAPCAADSKAAKTPVEIEKLEDQKLADRVADNAAEQAGKTEQRYDQDHDIFTK